MVADDLRGRVPFVSTAAEDSNADELAATTVWLAGDSTVMTYDASYAPLQGWGQHLQRFLLPAAQVNNQALGGRSTRTFVYGNVTCNNGEVGYQGGGPSRAGTRWERIEQNIVAGDFCLIQFGHNDAGGVCERHVELDEYRANLRAMVEEIRARDATPILVTPMSQLVYRNGSFRATLTDYAAAMRGVGQEHGVETIDLNMLSFEHYAEIGFETLSSQYFAPNDSTHFQEAGAEAMARLVSQALATGRSGLRPYVLD